jgi:hypothetical protein
VEEVAAVVVVSSDAVSLAERLLEERSGEP